MDRASRIVYVRRNKSLLEVLLTLQSGLTVGPSGVLKSRIWKIPGGTCLPNESFEEAALRKFKEKTGIFLPVAHRRFQFFVYTTNARYIERVYLAFDGNPESLETELPFHSKEIESARWFDLYATSGFRTTQGSKGVALGYPFTQYITKIRRKYANIFA